MKVVATPGAENVVAGMGAGGVILFVLLFFVVMALLAPLLLQIGVWLVTKHKPKYKEAFFTNLKIIGAGMGVGMVLGLVLGVVGAITGMRENLVGGGALLCSFPVTAYFYGRFIKLPETGAIGIGKGALVMLAQFLLYIAICVGVVILTGIVSLMTRM